MPSTWQAGPGSARVSFPLREELAGLRHDETYPEISHTSWSSHTHALSNSPGRTDGCPHPTDEGTEVGPERVVGFKAVLPETRAIAFKH
jgi:hypothetical protein